MDHDSLFKRLLRTFFRDFLQAFVPELHRRLGAGAIVFLDKELLPTAGSQSRRRTADLVAKVPLRRRGGLILAHTECQAQPQKKILWRMLCAAIWLEELYQLRVYPILLCCWTGKRRWLFGGR